MKLSTKISAVAVAATFAVAAPASAGLLDFTDAAVGTSGTLASGVTWTVTSNPGGLNRNQAFNGGDVAAIAPLKGDLDGFGVGNDEVTNGTAGGVFQTVTVTFSEDIRLLTTYFLDVYFGDGVDGPAVESGRVLAAGSAADANTFDAEVFASHENPRQAGVNTPGFAVINGAIKGSAFTFFAGPGKDDGSADVSLAGISVAQVPVPAGFLLLGTALGGLGLARRRKKAA